MKFDRIRKVTSQNDAHTREFYCSSNFPVTVDLIPCFPVIQTLACVLLR